jgi:hypothetical protein
MDAEGNKGEIAAKGQEHLGTEKTKQNGGNAPPRAGGLWLFFLVMVLFIVGSVVASVYFKQESTLKINFSYLALALIGVFFHLANQYRVRRDEEGFIWNEYKFDYYFRALQACIYVIIINHLVREDQLGFSGGMATVSLFVGMYIRKVEEAFETLGDRFGDTLRGILGSAVQRLTPAERRQKLAELEERWTVLRNDYLKAKATIEEPKRKEVEKLLSKSKELIVKNKIEAAELKVLNLDFKIKDLSTSEG